MTITATDADAILQKRFPTPAELLEFPFGDILYKLWNRKDDEGKIFREHGPKVLDNINTMLRSEPWKIINSMITDVDKELIKQTKLSIIRCFNESEATTHAFFRIAALYHDIGKYIIRERHPTVGWYTMEYLNNDHKNSLRTLLSDSEDFLQLLLIMIRDHDKFGVISTGEGSYPILIGTINSFGNSIEDQKRVLGAIMWLNIADMAGSPGIDVSITDIRKFIHDWNWVINIIDNCCKSKRRFDDYIVEEASQDEIVEARITRLLVESCRGKKRRAKVLRNSMPFTMVQALVHKELSTVFPTIVSRRNFARQFTHICKLDYGLRFFGSLVEYYEGPPDKGEDRKLPKHAAAYITTEDLIYAILAILQRLTSTFHTMSSSDNIAGNLIGVEMKDLTPANASEKTAQIIELLHKSHYPGLSWMMSDCLAWYF